MCLQSAEFRYRIRGDSRSPSTVQQIAKTTASYLHEKIMQTLGEGDGFFSLPAVRGPDARERFRTSQAVKYESLPHQLRKFSSTKNLSKGFMLQEVGEQRTLKKMLSFFMDHNTLVDFF